MSGRRRAGDEQYRRMLSSLDAVSSGGSATLERLAADVKSLLANEVETRRLLAEQVYGVPDEWLDELLRVRLDDASPD
jgi:hypothetical protein